MSSPRLGSIAITTLLLIQRVFYKNQRATQNSQHKLQMSKIYCFEFWSISFKGCLSDKNVCKYAKIQNIQNPEQSKSPVGSQKGFLSNNNSSGIFIHRNIFTEDPTATTKCVRVWSAGTGFPRAFLYSQISQELTPRMEGGSAKLVKNTYCSCKEGN